MVPLAVTVVAATGSGVVPPYPAVGGVANAFITVLSVASFESAEFADCVVAVVPFGNAGVPLRFAAVVADVAVEAFPVKAPVNPVADSIPVEGTKFSADVVVAA